MFSCDFCETAKNNIFTDPPATPASVCTDDITKLSVNQPKCFFQPFEALINTEMYTCEINVNVKGYSLSSLLIV